MELTRVFPSEMYQAALESWSWLPIAGKAPVLATSFGDVFLADQEGYWFLDSVGGKLTKIAADRDALKAVLSSREGQDEYLMAGLAFAAEQQGIQLASTEVLDFVIPPVLGGKLEVGNLAARDFAVSLNLAGQIHDQVRNLPPGTPVSGIKLT